MLPRLASMLSIPALRCAGSTALGAPVELPANGAPAHGVPVDMHSQPADPKREGPAPQ